MSNRVNLTIVGLMCCLSGPVLAQQVGGGNSSSNSGSTAGSTATSNSNVGTSRAAGGSASANSGTGGTAVGGNPTSTASSGASSSSTGPVTLNVYTPDPSAGTASGTGQAATAATPATTNNVNYSGTTTLRNTPDVGAPSIYGGTNPCSVGASAGLGIPGFGLSGGVSWSDKGCERRNTAVILYQANKARVAEALLCQDVETRAAFMAASDPCPQDRVPVAMASVAAVQTAAAPVAATAPAALPATKVSSGYVGPRPAWCGSAVKDSTDQAFHSFYCKA